MPNILRLTSIAGPACALLLSWTPLAMAKDDRLTLTPTTFRAGDRLVQGDRGHLTVPENREDADSAMIDIAFVRFRDPEGRSAPPVVYLPGGPGQPVLEQMDHLLASYQAYLSIGGQGDMLVADQRGIGASRPRLDCPGLLSRPADQPLSADVMGSTHISYIETCMDHWGAKGVDLSGYDVISMAEDIDELRASLGYHKIRLFGESFGAHHALAVMQKHGDHVERAALSAVIGPDDMFETPSTIERQLERLDGARGAGRPQDVRALMTSVLDGLNHPVPLSIVTPDGEFTLNIGRYDLALATVNLARQTGFMQQLPALYQQIAAGDLTWLARWSAILRRGHQANLASLAITCASGASAERRDLIARQADASLFGDAVDLLGADACRPVDGLDYGERFSGPITASMPVLMMSAELDPRAPPRNAEALLGGLPSGHHVIFPDVSHDFGQARAAQIDLAYRFLAHGETEPNEAFLPPGSVQPE